MLSPRLLLIHPRFKLALILLAVLILAMLISGPALAQQTWTASYWNNTSLSGPPTYQRAESQPPDFNWGEGSPVPGVINSDRFSAQWRASIHFDPGKYRFNVSSDDGNRLWVGGKLLINQWRDSSGITYTAEIDILETGNKEVILEYYENTGLASVALTWERVGGDISTTGPIRAEYFANTDLLGQPSLVRYETTPLAHNWGSSSPAPGLIPSDNFSARYTYTIDLNPGRYRFNTQAATGMRLWVNGQLVIDQWQSASGGTSIDVDLPGGITHLIATYRNTTGPAYINVNAYQVGGSGGGTGGGEGGGTGGGTGAGLTATVDTSYLNMREGPGTNFAVITVLRRGTPVILTGQVSDYWVQVREPTGYVGWVSSSFLDFNNLNVTSAG